MAFADEMAALINDFGRMLCGLLGTLTVDALTDLARLINELLNYHASVLQNASAEALADLIRNYTDFIAGLDPGFLCWLSILAEYMNTIDSQWWARLIHRMLEQACGVVERLDPEVWAQLMNRSASVKADLIDMISAEAVAKFLKALINLWARTLYHLTAQA